MLKCARGLGGSYRGSRGDPQELPLLWDDTETVTHMFLKHGDWVDVVYEDHTDP
jgi:hypothetical protein